MPHLSVLEKSVCQLQWSGPKEQRRNEGQVRGVPASSSQAWPEKWIRPASSGWIAARTLYGRHVNDESPMTVEEIAADYSLPVEAVQEASLHVIVKLRQPGGQVASARVVEGAVQLHEDVARPVDGPRPLSDFALRQVMPGVADGR